MKERLSCPILSYLGFYNLFDRVKTLEKENQEFKAQEKLILELQKDNQEVKKEHKEMQAQIKMLLDTIQNHPEARSLKIRMNLLIYLRNLVIMMVGLWAGDGKK